MPLTPKEKVLVDRILTEEIRWRVQRWFFLFVVLAIPVVGYLLRGFLGESFAAAIYAVGIAGLIQVISRWRGSAANQLLIELANRVDEAKEG